MARLNLARSCNKPKAAKVAKVVKVAQAVAAYSHPFSFDRCCIDCIAVAPVQRTVYRCASRFLTPDHDSTIKPW